MRARTMGAAAMCDAAIFIALLAICCQCTRCCTHGFRGARGRGVGWGGGGGLGGLSLNLSCWCRRSVWKSLLRATFGKPRFYSTPGHQDRRRSLYTAPSPDQVHSCPAQFHDAALIHLPRSCCCACSLAPTPCTLCRQRASPQLSQMAPLIMARLFGPHSCTISVAAPMRKPRGGAFFAAH